MTEEAAIIDGPTETPAPPAEVPGAPEPEVKAEDPPKAEEPKIDGVQKRINKEVARRGAAERRAKELEEKLAKFESASTSAPAIPNEQDYAIDSPEYKTDLVKYHQEIARHSVQEALKESTQKTALDQEETRLNELFSDFDQKVAKSDIKDFYNKTSNLPEFSPEVRDVMMMCENGPEVVNYMSEHLDVAEQLVGMSPYQAALKVGVISAGLATKKPNSISSAPDPVEPLKQGGNAVGEKVDPAFEGATFS